MHLPLPLTVILDTRAKMRSKKSPGQDGVTVEILRLLDAPCLELIRDAFERRLNCLAGACDPVLGWLEVSVHCIPKVRSARSLSQWRPISLVAALAKWFGVCLVYMLRTYSDPPVCNLFGSEPGRQCDEMFDFIKLLLERSEKWNLPIHMGKGDVGHAFGSMSHPVLDASLKRRRLPLRLSAATLRELVAASLFVRVQDAVSPLVVLGKGGRQGGTETPAEWNFLLDHALHDTVQCWLRRRYGWDPGDGLPPISHVAWADDLFWFSPCFAQFASMSRPYVLMHWRVRSCPGSLRASSSCRIESQHRISLRPGAPPFRF